ncbi:hypothetical protein T4E_2526 [Trichinella pseudospiralis]|uniref:Uncharacterized protein n=1 Tax=Trichinella pseudospiralis TaxID=6337 RepID=A0A0V0XVY5_TRIPS|nr:hypothetical protein T4E_2526 [Trichinella pseudospiralis]
MDSSPNEIWSLDFITDDDSDRRATLKTDIMIGERYRSAVSNLINVGSNCSNCKHGNLSYHTVYSYHEKQRISSSSIHDMLIGTTKASYS